MRRRSIQSVEQRESKWEVIGEGVIVQRGKATTMMGTKERGMSGSSKREHKTAV
jgi:hypothetical protein